MPSLEPQTSDLVFDEVGRATMPFGAHLLQTAFVPVYRVDATGLAPCAFRAITVTTDLSGRILPDAPEAILVRPAARRMHHFNLVHRDNDEMAYIERWDGLGNDAGTGLDALLAAAGTADMAPDQLIWEIGCDQVEALDPQIEQAHRLGVACCVCLDNDHLLPFLTHTGEDLPDLVHLESKGSYLFNQAPGASAVLRMAIAQFEARGVSVLVGDITTPAQLEAALATGADRLEGALFGPPVLAGRRAGWQTRDARAVAKGESTVVAFRRQTV